MSIAEWLNTTFASFDYRIFDFFHNLHDGALGGFFSVFFKFITILGDDGIFLVILSLVFLLFKKTRKAGMAMLGAVIVGALFTNITIKPIIARPRPYTNTEWDVYQWWVNAGSTLESEYSFPSGHTTSAMAAMTGLFFIGNKKYSWTAFLFAILMGMSRVFLCVHYPSDILGGFIVGFIAGLIASMLVKWFYSRKDIKLNQRIVEFDIIKAIKK